MDNFDVSNDLLNDADALRERMRLDGYLFFRKLIDPEMVLATRRQILIRCGNEGWLKAGTNGRDGVATPGTVWVEPQPEFMAVYNDVLKDETFNRLAFDPSLLAMLETLFGERPLPHARNIARIVFPQNTKFTTPTHQDYIHIQGTPETYTAWAPLGDCPASLGSLAVLSGSNTGEIYPVESAYGAGGLGIDTTNVAGRWVGGDFGVGDVILFHSLTAHKALPNLSQDRIRLSVDFRYQPLSYPIAQSSLEPHHGRLTWDEIYKDWKDDSLKYYWRDLPIRYADPDERVAEIRSAAGTAGDPSVRSANDVGESGA